MKFNFNKNSIEKAIGLFSANQNFIYTALPRLKALYDIKKEFKNIANLEWSFEFDHVNVNTNRLLISYSQDKSSDFEFYYEIPLIQRFELRVYLAKSSVHFLDIYNFLIEKNIITSNQFILKAEYHTIPHFIINENIKRYNQGILNQYRNEKDFDGELIDSSIKNEIERGFRIFNPIFSQILNQFII